MDKCLEVGNLGIYEWYGGVVGGWLGTLQGAFPEW